MQYQMLNTSLLPAKLRLNFLWYFSGSGQSIETLLSVTEVFGAFSRPNPMELNYLEKKKNLLNP